MNLPDWVSSSKLGTVSNNDSNTTFPQQKPKQPRFPHAFLPEHCASTQRMLAAARTHSLPSHHLHHYHPPPCLTAAALHHHPKHRRRAHTPPSPRHATPPPTHARLHATAATPPPPPPPPPPPAGARPTLRPRCAVLCLAQKAPANTAIPTWCCCAVGCATTIVPRPPYIGSVKTGP